MRLRVPGAAGEGMHPNVVSGPANRLHINFANSTPQGSRWRPKPPLGDEAISCIDDCPLAHCLRDRYRQCQLCSSPLMAIEGASVKISVAVKGEKTKCDPNNANRLTAPKLYGDIGHANPSPGKAEQAATVGFRHIC